MDDFPESKKDNDVDDGEDCVNVIPSTDDFPEIGKDNRLKKSALYFYL